MFTATVLALSFILKLVRIPNNLSNYITSRYGESGFKLFRKFETTNLKLIKVQLDIKFLTNCKAHSVIPKFLRFKLYRKSLQSSNFYSSWLNKLLINEIRFKRRSCRNLESELHRLLQSINCTFSLIDGARIKRVIRRSVDKLELDTATIHSRKLHSLGINSEVKPCDPRRVIHNFSSVFIPERVKFLLAFGLDFCLPTFKLDFYKYFLSFEKLLAVTKNIECQNKIELQNSIKSVALKYYYNFKPHKIFSSVIGKFDISLLKKFSSNKTICVMKPDKGNGVVVVDKDKYVSSMHKILADSSKFKEITDPIEKFTLKIEDKINNFVRKLKRLKLITDDVYNKLTVHGSAPGILYGLPKIHKKDFGSKFQFRPIFAAYKTPSFNLAKFLVPILNPFTANEFTCINSRHFVQDVTKVKTTNSCFMASFDVSNLFTNVPLRETIDICLEHLFANPTNTVIGLSKSLFGQLLQLSVLNSFFTFDSKFYQQTDGLGMGLPLGPTFANIFMSYHERRWLDDCPTNFKPIFYRRYVDDTFLLFSDPSHVDKFHSYLNRQHPSIKFTYEIENNRKLSFLDCCVHREDLHFSCSVFRKDSFTGLGTSFYSFCPMNFKINAIKTLLFRAFNVCSNYNYLHDEFSFLTSFFRSNGYCSFFVQNCIKKFMAKKYRPDDSTQFSKPDVFFSLPYFGPQSLKLKEELMSLFRKFIPDRTFSFILCNRNTIGSLFPYKDRLPTHMLSSVIYEFCCSQCESGYVGMTSRNLYMRVAEHVGKSFRTGVPLSSPPHSAVREHTVSCDSRLRSSDFKVLASASSTLDLKILESLYILKTKPKLNNMQCSYPLSIHSG